MDQDTRQYDYSEGGGNNECITTFSTSDGVFSWRFESVTLRFDLTKECWDLFELFRLKPLSSIYSVKHR